jgi:hypothetical protein
MEMMVLFILILVGVLEVLLMHWTVSKLVDMKSFKEYLKFQFDNKDELYVGYVVVMSILGWCAFFIANSAIYNTFIK